MQQQKYSDIIAEKIKEILSHDPRSHGDFPTDFGNKEQIFQKSIKDKMYTSFEIITQKETEMGSEDMDEFMTFRPSVHVVIIPEKHGKSDTITKVKSLMEKGNILVSLEFDEDRHQACLKTLNEDYEDDGHNDARQAAVDLVEMVGIGCKEKGNVWIYSDTENEKVDKELEEDDLWLTRRNFNMVCQITRKLIEEFENKSNNDRTENILCIAIHIGENHNMPDKCLNEGTITNLLIGFGFDEQKIEII